MASKKKKSPKGSWVVRMRCVVTKEYVFSDCTKEEANEPVWDKVVDEVEIDQIECKVLSVEPNK